MFEACKRISFCAAHRLNGYIGPCSNTHGHNYFVDIYINEQKLNDLGMVMDFKDIKKFYDKWINENWDHAFIHHCDDKVSQKIVKILNEESNCNKTYAMPYNPTAENMAKFLFDMGIINNFPVVKIRVWETLTSYAEYFEDGSEFPKMDGSQQDLILG